MGRRRLIPLLAVALLAVPVTAWGARATANGSDGTLSIQRGKGTVNLQAYGAVIAQIRRGRVKVRIYAGRHQGEAVVRMLGSGTIRHVSGATVYNGHDIRVRIVDQRFHLQINGVGIHLSAVAQGTVALQARPTASDPGVFSLDGGPDQPLPALLTTYALTGFS